MLEMSLENAERFEGTDITVLWATGLGSLDIADMVAGASGGQAADWRLVMSQRFGIRDQISNGEIE